MTLDDQIRAVVLSVNQLDLPDDANEKHDATTVPQAIVAFIESTDFEDAIRNAISLGGDSDTLAAITGSIAEAAYGVPDAIKDKALSFLDAPLREVYERWATCIRNG